MEVIKIKSNDLKHTYMHSLKLLRKKNKLSQQEVGAYLGVSKVSYCMKETGKRPISLFEANKLSKLYDQSIESIFFK